MKKCIKYIIFIEIVVLIVLSKLEISAEGFAQNAIGLFLALMPIWILLYTVFHDTSNSASKRLFCRLLFWFLVACYIVGCIVTFVTSF